MYICMCKHTHAYKHTHTHTHTRTHTQTDTHTHTHTHTHTDTHTHAHTHTHTHTQTHTQTHRKERVFHFLLLYLPTQISCMYLLNLLRFVTILQPEHNPLDYSLHLTPCTCIVGRPCHVHPMALCLCSLPRCRV